MKIALLLLLLNLHMLQAAHMPPATVYVCNSAKGKKYHLRPDCRGLSSCQHRVVKMTLVEAQKRGYTLCGWEK